MAAAKALAMATVTVVAARNSVAIRALTTVAMARAVPHHAVRVLKAVARHVAHKVARGVVKTAAGAMVTNCHATLTR